MPAGTLTFQSDTDDPVGAGRVAPCERKYLIVLRQDQNNGAEVADATDRSLRRRLRLWPRAFLGAVVMAVDPDGVLLWRVGQE